MERSKRMGILLPAMLWLASACASTAPAYVTPVPDAQPARDARVDERVTAVEKRVNEMGQRVQTLEGGVAGAQSRADEAARKAEGVNSRLTRLWTNRLSQRRVDAVRRFLMDRGIQLARIQAASLGPISSADIPDVKKRRVTLRLMVDQE